MTYLLLDTSSNNLIVSIIRNNEVLYFYNDINNNETSAKVMPAIDEAFTKTGLNINDIHKLFIVNGPGSFTGIRVGVTIAKVIGYCLNIPLIAISELELLATTKTRTDYNVSIIDARRGYVYGAIYDKALNPVFQEQHILLTELEKQYPKSHTIITNDNMDIDIVKIIQKHEQDEPVHPHELKPNYLKKTEAEENLDATRSE